MIPLWKKSVFDNRGALPGGKIGQKMNRDKMHQIPLLFVSNRHKAAVEEMHKGLAVNLAYRVS